MHTEFVNLSVFKNDLSNYLIGGVECNAFVLGSLGATDDFFLIGAPASEVDNYPILTGNFLDSEGNHLFRLVRNVLVVNPRNCSKILGNHIGYEIDDGNGQPVFRVNTVFKDTETGGEYITTIHGTFYGKGGVELGKADALALKETGMKFIIGFGGNDVTGFASSQLTENDKTLAELAVASGGRVHEVVSGVIADRELKLDGKFLWNARVSHCKIIVQSGDFAMHGTSFSDCEFIFIDSAERVRSLVLLLNPNNQPVDSDDICKISGVYISLGCPHVNEQELVIGNQMPRCPQCGRSVAWLRKH